MYGTLCSQLIYLVLHEGKIFVHNIIIFVLAATRPSPLLHRWTNKLLKLMIVICLLLLLTFTANVKKWEKNVTDDAKELEKLRKEEQKLMKVRQAFRSGTGPRYHCLCLSLYGHDIQSSKA